MTSHETLWQEIASTALVGAQRKPFAPSRVDGSLGDVLEAAHGPALAPDDEARVLLRAVSVAAMHRKAGRLPPLAAPSLPAPAAQDEWQRCSPQAGRFLKEILTSNKNAMLPEWVRLAAKTRQRVREEHLPLLLSQQKLIQSMRADVLPVLGERGRWLASLNPEWSTFVYFDDERIWHEGPRKERLACLTDLRARDPRRAAALLAETWSQEPPAERVVFLEALENGLCMEDEPFLESVLDDRRKDVRQAAADLLARLPESRLVARMRERARGMLNMKNSILRTSIEVRLPERCDEGLLRDGIEPRPPSGSRLGEHAWWLAQMLGMAPLQTWTAAWNKRPSQILDLIRKNEWEDALLMGWSEAGIRFADMEWLEALVTHEMRRDNAPRVFEIFPRLPDALKEKLLISLLRDNPPLSYEQPASVYLAACRHPWSVEMTQAVTTTLCAAINKGDMQPWRWEKLLRDIAPCFHPNLLMITLDRIAAAQKKKPSGDTSVNNLLAILQFRLEMVQAFQ